MEPSIAPPSGIAVIVVALCSVLASILPTCLYLYVEPRGRAQWAEIPDGPTGRAAGAPRRAPALVRLTAWLSFAVGQLALPWLLVPAACALLVYLQASLGVARPMGVVVTVGAALAALAESALAMGLLPLGVRLLARDARLRTSLGRRARWNGVASALALGACAASVQAMVAFPSLVHPWLRVTLTWTALRPVMAYAAVCLLHAILLGRCARAMADDPEGNHPWRKEGT
jgi:hypothetical protein